MSVDDGSEADVMVGVAMALLLMRDIFPPP